MSGEAKNRTDAKSTHDELSVLKTEAANQSTAMMVSDTSEIKRKKRGLCVAYPCAFNLLKTID